MPGPSFRIMLNKHIIDLQKQLEELDAEKARLECDIDDTEEELEQCRKNLAEVIEDERKGR